MGKLLPFGEVLRLRRIVVLAHSRWSPALAQIRQTQPEFRLCAKTTRHWVVSSRGRGIGGCGSAFNLTLLTAMNERAQRQLSTQIKPFSRRNRVPQSSHPTG